MASAGTLLTSDDSLSSQVTRLESANTYTLQEITSTELIVFAVPRHRISCFSLYSLVVVFFLNIRGS